MAGHPGAYVEALDGASPRRVAVLLELCRDPQYRTGELLGCRQVLAPIVEWRRYSHTGGIAHEFGRW